MGRGRRFGRLVIGLLTALWCAEALVRVHALVATDSLYLRMTRLLPGTLPAAGWTLTFTLVVLWSGLLWQRYRAPVPLLTPAELMQLEPAQFERHVALIFRRRGHRVYHRGGAGDHGVDLEVCLPSGRLGIVQCKRHRSTVGERVVRDLYGTMLHEEASHSFLVTTGAISSAAYAWAEGKPMTLVDGEGLLDLARNPRRGIA